MKSERGFSTLEVLLSMMMFLVILSGLIKMNGYLHTLSAQADEREQMIYVAANVIEEVKAGNQPDEGLSDAPYIKNVQVIETSKYLEEVKVSLESKKFPKLKYETSHIMLKREVFIEEPEKMPIVPEDELDESSDDPSDKGSSGKKCPKGFGQGNKVGFENGKSPNQEWKKECRDKMRGGR